MQLRFEDAEPNPHDSRADLERILHISSVVDLCSRRVIGCSMDESMRAQICCWQRLTWRSLKGPILGVTDASVQCEQHATLALSIAARKMVHFRPRSGPRQQGL